MISENLYIGLMSGTSMDGIDAILLDLHAGRCQTLATHYAPYSAAIRSALLALVDNRERADLGELGDLDARLGYFYADAVQELLAKTTLTAASIKAVGSHGQTVLHHPPGTSDRGLACTIQIGDPNIIACKTQITTVADFRRRDIAAGGQGAPLVPAFHAAFFRNATENRVVLNIGGIANITVLPADGRVSGFDTGPGNTLLDQWAKRYLDIEYDTGGSLAAKGKPVATLLAQLERDRYFQLPPPKSTGREYFNLAWLETYLADFAQYSPMDVLATLTELTAVSIAAAIGRYAPESQRVYICGGGIHNHALMNRLEQLLPEAALESTASAGLDPDYVEAAAFAWLAKQTLERQPGNIPAVTGAQKPVVLGGIYPA